MSGLRLRSSFTQGNRTAKVYRDEEWSEFRVKFFEDSSHLTEADYHTDDFEDAKDTAMSFTTKGATPDA